MFNVQSYIKHCADSLFSQTLDSLQFIFVNDCSTDNSVRILEYVIEHDYSYLKCDILIINLPQNGGVANARNIGISHATGDYIGFVDADDWIDLNFYKELYKVAQKDQSDIVACNFINEYPTGSRFFDQKYKIQKYEYIRGLLNGEIFPSLCTEIVRRSLYMDNNIFFVKELNMGEDLLVNIKLVLFSNKNSFVNKYLYHYRHTNTSSCVNKSIESIMSDVKIAYLIEKTLKMANLDKRFNIEINYRKFFSKLPFWVNHEYRQISTWRNLFPESNRYILCYKQLDLKIKFECLLVAHHMSGLAKFFSNLLKWQHVIRTYYNRRSNSAKR